MSPASTTRPAARSRWTPSPLTLALALAAGGAALWAHLDARDPAGAQATLVSTRSAAWRVLPELSTLSSEGSTVELWPSMGEPVRLVAVPGGHQVLVGERVLGPADPEAIEGVWDSLRMATTVRAAAPDSDAGVGDGGRIVVMLPGSEGTRTLQLGRPTVDGAGVYGTVEGGAEGTEGLWVLEQEMSELVQQAPEAWLARRAVVAEPADLVAVRDGDRRLTVGLDGLWRVEASDGAPGSILDSAAVRTRLTRILSARLDPLVDPNPDAPGTPWITLEGADGVDWTLTQHGPCVGRPDRVLIDRGPGQWGCVDGALVNPWPVPGTDSDAPGQLLEVRLAPHAYGRVLRIQQQRPEARTLARYGGGWRIEQDLDGRTLLLDVDEDEVFAWYQALYEAEVTLAPESSELSGEPQVDLQIITDSTATLRLRCWEGEPWTCRRDDGPWLIVREERLRPSFDADTFAEHRLASVRSEDVRAIEILPGPAGSEVLRQSAHFDLGVWRLDAPVHPEGDAALDALRLEALLGTLGGLRADAWVDGAEDEAPLRRLRIERVPRRGQDPVLEVALLPECVVRVAGHRPARVSEGTCETLGHDLLVTWPLQRIIDTARNLELTLDGRTVRLKRRGDAWSGPDGAPALDANTWLRSMHERTASAVERRDALGSQTWRLRVLPTRGTAFAFEGGADWARVEGQDWIYRLDEPDGEFDELDGEPDDPGSELDGSGGELDKPGAELEGESAEGSGTDR